MSGRWIRQVGALMSAGTFMWELFRLNPEEPQQLPMWALVLHFLYFQLPLRSRALTFFHAASFASAHVVLWQYLYTRVYVPELERQQLQEGDLTWESHLLRAVLLHIAPLLLHWLDITTHQTRITAAYESVPRVPQIMWSVLSYFVFAAVYEARHPNFVEYYDVKSAPEVERNLFWLSVGAAVFSYALLYVLVVRRAYAFSSKRGL